MALSTSVAATVTVAAVSSVAATACVAEAKTGASLTAAIVRLTVWVAVRPAASVAVTTKLSVPL